MTDETKWLLEQLPDIRCGLTSGPAWVIREAKSGSFVAVIPDAGQNRKQLAQLITEAPAMSRALREIVKLIRGYTPSKQLPVDQLAHCALGAVAISVVTSKTSVCKGQPDQPEETGCAVTVTFDELPAAGAYLTGSAQQGEAKIQLNARLALRAAKSLGGTVQEQTEAFRQMLADGLAHEMLHACQELVGAAFSETDIEAALQQANGDSDEVQWQDDTDEAREQVIQSLLAEREALIGRMSELQKALSEAASSLEAISDAGNRGLDSMFDVRGYAHNRATVARKVLDQHMKEIPNGES